MGCAPTERELLENTAVVVFPLPVTSDCVARTVAPSEKVMVPVGDPGLVDVFVTVAVKVTDWP